MARIRTVKPGMFSSFHLALAPIAARYLYIGLWTEADDEGLLIDSPKRIAGALFPHDEKVTERHVDRWLDTLASPEVDYAVLRYASGNGRYLFVVEWLQHQRISHALPSILPKPSGETLENFRTVSGKQHDLFRPEGEWEGEKEKEGEKEGFDRFWAVYPRRDDKAKARLSFARALRRTDLASILAGAERYRDDPNREQEFTKMPTTWLNGDCWDNGPLPPRSSRNGTGPSKSVSAIGRAMEVGT